METQPTRPARDPARAWRQVWRMSVGGESRASAYCLLYRKISAPPTPAAAAAAGACPGPAAAGQAELAVPEYLRRRIQVPVGPSA